MHLKLNILSSFIKRKPLHFLKNSLFCTKCEGAKDLVDTNDPLFLTSIHLYENFISEDEEKQLLGEIEPYMKRLRYEFDHWDNVSLLCKRRTYIL